MPAEALWRVSAARSILAHVRNSGLGAPDPGAGYKLATPLAVNIPLILRVIRWGMAKTLATTVHHIKDLRFVAESGANQRVMIDNEKHARTGMSPMELLLSATATCAAMDVQNMIKKRKLNISSYRVDIVGERPEGVPSPFTHITAKHVFDVPGLDRRTAERFVNLATTKYCSVGLSLKADISWEVELLHEQ